MILVFGSINVDFVYQVDKLPLPGETLRASGFQILPGGKGANQAVAAARAGGKVMMAGSVGTDPLGLIGLQALKEAHVDVHAIKERPGPSGTAAINVDSEGENAIVVAAGANALTSAGDIDAATLDGVSTLLLQMEIPHHENWRLAKKAKSQGIRTILNLAPFAAVPEDALQDIDILICNEVEFLGLADGRSLTGDKLVRKIRDLSEACDLAIIVTLGGNGVVACQARETFEVPALETQLMDSTGAGDAFCGVFAASLDTGCSFDLALRMGSVAGAMACQKLGAQASLPDRQTIESALPGLAKTIKGH